MKTYLLVAVLLIAATSNAAIISWDADVTINDDGSTNWAAVLTYNETVEKSDYFVFSRISDIQVFADNVSVECSVSYDIGTSIVCNDMSASIFVYKFHVKGLIDNVQNLKLFHYPFSVTSSINRMNVIVRFPVGAALVENEKLVGTGIKRFEPDFGREGSDGRRIFISWTFDKPVLGQTINISAIYELIGFSQFTLFGIILAFVIISFVGILIFFFKKHGIRDMLPVLTDGERRVMEILLRERGEADQRIIVKETDFSKPKVTRIINNLVSRGLVDKVMKGRKNLIKLKKTVKQPEIQKSK